MSEERRQKKLENSREYYRVVFPAVERPVLRSTEGQFDVVDLSESGLRFAHGERHTFRIGYRIEGDVVFHDDSVIAVEGSVLRTIHTDAGHQTVLLLANGVAQDVIIRAQQRIIRRYPGFSGDSETDG